MKRSAIIFAALAAVIVSPFARAEGSLSDAQLNAIRTNCVDARISLQHTLDADRSTRINRGSRYDAVLKLMTSFNSRVAENKIDAPELITIASSYQKMWDSFIVAYTEYDDAMTALIQVDCKSEPTTFYDQLTLLRNKRTSLKNYVKDFNSLLDKYQKGVDSIKQSLGGSQ
jgi:hypothetical protein